MLKRVVYGCGFFVMRGVLFVLIWALSPEVLNRISFILPGRLLIEALRYLGAEIGDHVRFAMPVTFNSLPANDRKPMRQLKIGEYTYLGRGVVLDLMDEIIIEDHVTLSMEVMLITHTHAGDSPLKDTLLPFTHTPIRICRGAYLGARATVLEGVTIGAESIVAAGAVVIQDVPQNSIVGGIPAKLLRMKTTEVRSEVVT